MVLDSLWGGWAWKRGAIVGRPVSLDELGASNGYTASRLDSPRRSLLTPIIRLSPDKRKAVEAWAKTALHKPSLSEAVRRLVDLGLASAHRSAARIKKAMEASEMAGEEIDRSSDPLASYEERKRRKKRLIKGPKEFRDIRRKRPKG